MSNTLSVWPVLCSIQKAMRDFYFIQLNQICKSKNSRNFYSYMNKRLGRVKPPVTLKACGGELLNNTQCGEAFAIFFLNPCFLTVIIYYLNFIADA